MYIDSNVFLGSRAEAALVRRIEVFVEFFQSLACGPKEGLSHSSKVVVIKVVKPAQEGEQEDCLPPLPPMYEKKKPSA